MVLSDQIKSDLCRHWPLQGEFRFHRRLANYVYFAELDGREVVLRLTETNHRQLDEIKSELDWMSYLASNGMRIVKPIASLEGALAVQLSGDNSLVAAVFEKAKGKALLAAEALETNMIQKWGRYLGKMHRLTKQYRPGPGIRRRQEWERDECLAMALRSLDPQDEVPYRRLQKIMQWMRGLPQDLDSYGLTHTDLHTGNFFVADGEITAFDFDDSCYHWFAYDLVMPVNSVFQNVYEGRPHLEKERALDNFLQGYTNENTLAPIWLKRFPVFDQYRAVLTYHWIKTFTREGVFDAKGMEWARGKAPELLSTMAEPLSLF